MSYQEDLILSIYNRGEPGLAMGNIPPGKGGSPGQPYEAPKEDPKNPHVPAPKPKLAGAPNFPGGGFTTTSGAFVDLSGEANYANMIDWAQKSLNEQEVKMFDAVIERGDPLAAFFAVRSLAYAYNDAIGYDGNMVQGKAPRQSNDQFRSQQEVVKAMADPRYEDDPAYRRDIMEKLERSPNVNF